MRIRRSLLVLLALLPALGAVARAEPEEELETIELIPEDRAGWSATNLFAPITGLFLGGPGYWYSERYVEVRTTPPGAALDLFYVRANFQKGYEQADAPVRVILPSRIEAGPRDHINIRAFMDGYRQKEVSVRVRSREVQVQIDLEPLPNSLLAVTHLYFSGRTALGFLTEEAVTFRLQKRDEGYSVVLLQTGSTEEAAAQLAGASDAWLGSLSPQQLGEDLVVRMDLTDRAREQGVELRSRQSYDPVRRLHTFSLDLSTPDGGARSVQQARAALARIGAAEVSGCALRFDAALRERLEPSALHRALAPGGSFTDPYLRAAMKRLGELSGGRVTLVDDTVYRVAIPIELSAATSQADSVRGYLALLREFVAELEPAPYRRGTLRGLIAPELTPAAFDAIVAAGEAAERACRSAGARAPGAASG